MTTDIQNLILRSLQYNEDFARKVFPYIKEEYFEYESQRIYFQKTQKYFEKYNRLPTKEALDIEFQSLKVNQETVTSLLRLCDTFEKEKNTPLDREWLTGQAEEFCQHRALFIGLNDAVEIMNGEHQENLSKTAIPEIMSKALAVSFDSKIGLNYLKETDRRYLYYTSTVSKLSFGPDVDSFNKITAGGVPRKTLNGVLAGTNVGKSIWLCFLAAEYMKQGYNVLYITLEMAEEELSKRIDAHMLNISIGSFDTLAKSVWDDKVAALSKYNRGNIVIREYPSGVGHCGHFRFLLRELKQKQNFQPDVVIIDYLTICASQKFKQISSMYEYYKTVAVELRGLATEYNVAVWTAMQFNRDGISNSDADMTNVAESMGTVHQFDFLFALIKTDQLTAINQILVKQIKSRYGDVDKNNKFAIGLDKDKMRFHDVTTQLNPPTTPTPSPSKPYGNAAGFLSKNKTPPKKPTSGPIIV